MPVDPSKLDASIARIKTAYGDRAISTGEFGDHPPRISTGNLELDMVTRGGIPIGRWTHMYGGFSSCKTLTCWNVIREAQHMGQTCVYYNAEKQYDKAWVAAKGVDVKKLIVVNGTIIEQLTTKAEELLKVAHLHVFDSLAACVPTDELSAKAEDWQMGLAARAWGKAIRRLNERFDDNENTVIMINQVRDAFGYGGGESPPGGKSVDFISSLSLYFRKSSWLFKDTEGVLDPEASAGATLSGDSEPNGMEFIVRVQKSRVCPPNRSARMRLDFDDGMFDNLWTLAKAAKHYGIVDVARGGWYTLDDGSKVQGLPKFRAKLASDDAFRTRIQDRMREELAA